LLDELYAAIDLPEAVPDLNPTDQGEYWAIDCPYCGKREARAFKKNTGRIVCRGDAECGRNFTLFRYYTSVKRLGIGEALKVLSDLAHHPLKLNPQDLSLYEKEQRRMTLLEEAERFFIAELWADKENPAMRHLLEKRKYTEEEIRRMGLGLIPSRARLGKHLREGRDYSEEDEKELGFTHKGLGETHTLTIPYRDPGGNLKGFAVMSVDSSGKGDGKYLWTADRDTLLNLDAARGHGIVAVVKDPLDALIACQRGTRETTATGGGSLTEGLIDDALKHGAKGFVLGHDLDMPGRDDTLRAIDLVRRDQKGLVFVMDLPEEYKDLEGYLNEHGLEDLVSMALRQGEYGIKWKTNRILDEYAQEKYGEQGGYRALEEIKDFQTELSDPLDREIVADVVSERTKQKGSIIEGSLDSYRRIKTRERLRKGLREISEEISNEEERDPEELLKVVSRRIKGLALKQEGTAGMRIQPLREFFNRQFALEMEREPDGLIGYPLKKFPEIAKKFDGIQPGLHIIGGSPGVGKTSLMVNLFLDLLSTNAEIRGVYFSFDESKEAIRSRLMSIKTEIPLSKIRKSHDSPLSYAKKRNAHNEFAALIFHRSLMLKDLSEISDMDDLELEIRDTCGDDFLIFIDGLSNLPAGGSGLDQDERVRKMKRWADTNRVPVFCTVNLKKPEGKPKRSNISDAQEIGDYGFPGSAVLLLSEMQHEKKARGENEPVSLVLKFERNKLSPFRGTIQLSFTPETGVIVEADEK
jgi:DNA primase